MEDVRGSRESKQGSSMLKRERIQLSGLVIHNPSSRLYKSQKWSIRRVLR